MKTFAEYLSEDKEVKGTYSDGKLSASVDVLIKLSKDLPMEERNVKDLVKTNHDTATKEGMFEDMINKPNKRFTKRMNKADMSYPILVDSNDYIIDGAHRLAKAYFNKKQTIEVKVISKDVLKQAAKITDNK